MTQPTRHFDFIVVGGGSGGYAAARAARETVGNVAIVDGARELGGLCILRGCMPSKTLIYAAEVLHLARKGAHFGLDVRHAEVDMPALRKRKRKIIESFADYRRQQLRDDRFTLFRQNARFVDPRTIRLDDGTCLTADRFMIATGSVVSVPPIQGLAETPCWTSDDVLDLDFVPEKVIVLGGGVVACELAQFLRRVGAKVVLVQRSPRVLKEYPAQAAAVVEKAFVDEGIRLHTDTRLTSVEHDGDKFTATFVHRNETVSVSAPHLLNALGRRPAVDGLGLDDAGVDTGPGGRILCDRFQRTSNTRVYACGDVAGPHEIVHVAIMQGEVGAAHATGRPVDGVDYDSLSGIVFTDPQIGVVGLGEDELRKRGVDFIAADYPFDDHGKTILMEATRGYVKVLAGPDGRILGAECVGKDGGELMHPMAVAVHLRADVRDLLKVHWYHPTVSEIWSYPLETIAERLTTAPTTRSPHENPY